MWCLSCDHLAWLFPLLKQLSLPKGPLASIAFAWEEASVQFIPVLLGKLQCPYVAAKIQLSLETKCVWICCVFRSVLCVSAPPSSLEIIGSINFNRDLRGFCFFVLFCGFFVCLKEASYKLCDSKWLQMRWHPVSLEGWQWTSVGSSSELKKFRLKLWVLNVQGAWIQGTRGVNVENKASVTECLGSFWFGLFSSFQRLVLFQKEPFNRRNMKEARVRKGMFSSLGSVS